MARRDRRRVLCPTCGLVVAIMATFVDKSGVRQCRRHVPPAWMLEDIIVVRRASEPPTS